MTCKHLVSSLKSEFVCTTVSDHVSSRTDDQAPEPSTAARKTTPSVDADGDGGWGMMVAAPPPCERCLRLSESLEALRERAEAQERLLEHSEKLLSAATQRHGGVGGPLETAPEVCTVAADLVPKTAAPEAAAAAAAAAAAGSGRRYPRRG